MDSNLNQKIAKILKNSRLRKTHARAAVLEALFLAKKPQTAEQIAAKLGIKSPNKVTIYRTLESLIKAGFVHKAYTSERKWHFEPTHHRREEQNHPHFVCNGCGATRCLTNWSAPMAKVPWKGFVIHHQQIKLEGLCPSCSTKTAGTIVNNKSAKQS